MTGQTISYGEFKRRFRRFSTVSDSEINVADIVIETELIHRAQFGGLSVLAMKHTEKFDLTNISETPAAISFNMMFEGEIDFSLGGNAYQLGKYKNGKAECSAFIVSQPEVFTRHMRANSRLSRVNVFAERDWLQQQAQSEASRSALQRVFQFHNLLHFWQPSMRVLELAQRLFSQNPSSSIATSLSTKAIALELLAYCIGELERFTQTIALQPLPYSIEDNDHFKLKKHIDDILLTRTSLDEIADTLGMSVSTLQRKFKGVFGITVNTYCRQQRLKIARLAISLDGISIGEAAYLAGYNHPSNFITAFKKEFNITPTELLKKLH